MYSFYHLENFSLAFDNNENHCEIQITPLKMVMGFVLTE